MGVVDRQKLKNQISEGLQPQDESIIELTHQYWHFVQAIEEATRDLEGLAQQLTQQADQQARKKNEQKVNQEKSSSTGQENAAASDGCGTRETFDDDHYTNAETGRRRASLVRRFKLPASLLSIKLKCEPSVDSQLERLEEHDVKISLLQYHLEMLERRILETRPQDSDNALKKMKFIASLIIDGHDLDVDYFAYLIQECAEVCEEQLEQIFQVYCEHVQNIPAFR